MINAKVVLEVVLDVPIAVMSLVLETAIHVKTVKLDVLLVTHVQLTVKVAAKQIVILV